MACFWLNQAATSIEILSYTQQKEAVFYNIQVTVGDIFWVIPRRYSEFYTLHQTLVIDHGLSKDILPDKQLLHIRSPMFIETRRKGLEKYLRHALTFLQQTMPKVFVNFLDFNKYDIFFLLQDMAVKMFIETDTILSMDKSHDFITLELFALTEFLQKAIPVPECSEHKCDIGVILDVCSQLQIVNVKAEGRSNTDTLYEKSSIDLCKLQFDLSPFKTLNTLNLKNLSIQQLVGLGNLRNTLVRLKVNKCRVSSIADILQCDVKWKELETLDLSFNEIKQIDTSLLLAPKLRNLYINDNDITTIENLSSLSNLSTLSIASNSIKLINDLHTKVGNILYLNMSQNTIQSCEGFSKMYSLESLDLSCNKIFELKEIQHLGCLPNLNNLALTGNPLAGFVDYRVKVLEYFGERAKDLVLDNEKPTQPELDKVNVLKALRIVREGKVPDLMINLR
nr:unnamed protein product [Callosobruchus analis]